MVSRHTQSSALIVVLSIVQFWDLSVQAANVGRLGRLPFAFKTHSRALYSQSSVSSSTQKNRYYVLSESQLLHSIIINTRGGANQPMPNTSDETVIEYDDEEESEESEDEGQFYDAVQGIEEDSDTESYEESDQESQEEISTDGIKIEVNVNKFDDPIVQSPMSGLFVSLGVMYLSRKFDLFSPNCVRAARWGFVCYLLLLQAFIFYFRIQAKRENNQTPIELQNPLFTILQNRMSSTQPKQEKSNDMVKNIASSILSNKSTIVEYDLQQTRNMQSGILFSILIQWVLHFKFEQIQPLIMASLNGVLQLLYSPLFQVYVMGKNLERPFKSPAMIRQEQSLGSDVSASDGPLLSDDDPNDTDIMEPTSGQHDYDEDEDEYDPDEDTNGAVEYVSDEEQSDSLFEDAVQDETS